MLIIICILYAMKWVSSDMIGTDGYSNTESSLNRENHEFVYILIHITLHYTQHYELHRVLLGCILIYSHFHYNHILNAYTLRLHI